MIGEKKLQELETQIGETSPEEAAAIAFAAIGRIGEHGREAGEAFAKLTEGASDDPDVGPNWEEGCGWISEHLA